MTIKKNAQALRAALGADALRESGPAVDVLVLRRAGFRELANHDALVAELHAAGLTIRIFDARRLPEAPSAQLAEFARAAVVARRPASFRLSAVRPRSTVPPPYRSARTARAS